MKTKEKIRMLLKMKDNMSVYELAREVDIIYGDLNYRLNTRNKKFTKEQIEKIANYFCVKTEWLESDEE